NIQTGADTITFDPTVFSTPQTITLTIGTLTLTDTATTTITGPGAGLLTVSGNHASRVFQINAGASAALSGLTMPAGSAPPGGGLSSAAAATLTDCTPSGNSASGRGGGGGLYNSGQATLTNCTISGNSAQRGDGGGVSNGHRYFFAAPSTVELTNCTV